MGINALVQVNCTQNAQLWIHAFDLCTCIFVFIWDINNMETVPDNCKETQYPWLRFSSYQVK